MLGVEEYNVCVHAKEAENPVATQSMKLSVSTVPNQCYRPSSSLDSCFLRQNKMIRIFMFNVLNLIWFF